MRGLDTNVILRYLTADDPEQEGIASAVFEEASARQERLFVGKVVLCELAWTLRGKPYRIDRGGIATALEKLLAASLFEIQDRDLVRQALGRYREGRADFADYLIGCEAWQAGCETVLTFDGKLRGGSGFSLLLA
jgi:predicted nucleic-acid-binding protein